ncbi:HAMP domain-containing histidine kinase [Thalassomonas viridans]|uniref:histidine kinase n=1 Tax=Thalassomonas viridans TaxID=137584 RepID=A0AAF0C7E1_9GAMM|nr:HAMP domain-containing sensor histidine kinase [Thalassomonas viridans]WDE03598.1 HAMP domain-containing histidine kinase [Thalassomonas viridans]
MKIKNSIKRRVFLVFGGFTLGLSLMFAGVSIVIAFVVEDEILARVIAEEARYIEQVFRERGELVQPGADYMRLYLSSELAPKEVAAALKDVPQTDNRSREIFTDHQAHYHTQWLNLAENRHALLVAEVSSLLLISNLPSDLVVFFVVVLVLALLLSLWLAYRISSRTTEPVLTLTRQVMAQQEHGTPIARELMDTEDETGFLAQTIARALAELNSAVKREAAFNRDVSHELRTPLTVLNNTLALADLRALGDKDIAQLKGAGEKMKQIVSTLLALARAESMSVEAIRLRPLMEECVLGIQDKLSTTGFEIHLDIPDNYRLSANPRLLVLLINNLMENALAHSSEPHLLIRAEQACLLFENAVKEPVSNDVTQPRVKQENSQGIGQGLYLVRRIIESLHWDFRLDNRAGFYRFIVCLPKQ